jgi:hypothetical protein
VLQIGGLSVVPGAGSSGNSIRSVDITLPSAACMMS